MRRNAFKCTCLYAKKYNRYLHIYSHLNNKSWIWARDFSHFYKTKWNKSGEEMHPQWKFPKLKQTKNMIPVFILFYFMMEK